MWAQVEPLECQACELLQQRLAERFDQSDTHELGMCPSLWLVHDLLALVGEFHDRPVTEIESLIRRMLHERCFVGDTGSALDTQAAEALLEAHLAVMVEVLEQVR